MGDGTELLGESVKWVRECYHLMGKPEQNRMFTWEKVSGDRDKQNAVRDKLLRLGYLQRVPDLAGNYYRLTHPQGIVLGMMADREIKAKRWSVLWSVVGALAGAVLAVIGVYVAHSRGWNS